ncbi:MAG: V-type ATP synthase subunit E [Termitinemataceae bacterium]|nr:MAG: V-type ATP synthase subunit E [Termitinemataceae bacterium]
MDIQLQELIEKIKKDGVESASQEAAKIKSNAEADAKRIVEDARKEAERLISEGKADAERSEKAGIAAVEQASRNLVLSFREEIQSILNRIVSRETAVAYNADAIKSILPDVIKGLALNKAVDVIVNEKDVGTLDSWAKGAISAEISKGLEIKAGKVGAGFKLAEKDGSAYFDFSSEAVAEALSAYLNPRLGDALKSVAKGL